MRAKKARKSERNRKKLDEDAVFVGCLRDARESSLATTQPSLISPDDNFRVQY